MAVKTITLDIEAYHALKRRKRRGQSFSDVVKEHFQQGATGREFRRVLAEARLDPSTLEAVEEIVNRRGADRAGAPEL